MPHEIKITELIDVDTVYVAGDTETLSYVLQQVDLPKEHMRRGMWLAVENNQLAMLQFLQEKDIPLWQKFINRAFSKGYQDLTRYLFSQGLRVDMNYVYLDEKAYTDVTEQDMLQYLSSIEVNAVDVNFKLMSNNNFILCRTFLAKKLHDVNIYDLLTLIVKHGRLDIAHDILRTYEIDMVELLIQAIKKDDISVVAFVCDTTQFETQCIELIFLEAYKDFHAKIMEKLILCFDPNLKLEIHRLKWHYFSRMPLNMIQLFCTLLPRPELDVNNLIYLPEEVLTYLVSIDWITTELMHDLWKYVMNYECLRLLKFCVTSDKVKFDPLKVKIGREYKNYQFLCALMELGVDVSPAMWEHHKAIFVKDYGKRLCLGTGKGLRWLAAACYVQHHKTLPDPEIIPADAMEFLHLAKYRPC